MYVYRQYKKTAYWEVGYFDPKGCWHQESMWSSQMSAADQVHWLNGEEKKYQRMQQEKAYSQWRTEKRNGLKAKEIFLNDLSQAERLGDYHFYAIALAVYFREDNQGQIQKAKTIMEYDYLCASGEQRDKLRMIYTSYFHNEPFSN